jgi:hypothetical protein
LAKKKSPKPRKGSLRDKKNKKPGVMITEIPGQVSLERSPFKLKGNIKYLSTNIDAMQNYVLEKKVVKLADAARKFGVPKKNIEEWGRILEDHNMIEMHYPVTGEPTFRITGYDKLRRGLKRHGKEKKERAPHKPRMPRLTKKRIMIIAEIVSLGELLIYIFLVNPHLRNNFIPTVNYQITNLPANIANMPNYLSSTGINPLYFLLAGVLLVFSIIVAIIARRKKKSRLAGRSKKGDKGKDNSKPEKSPVKDMEKKPEISAPEHEKPS